MLAAPLSSIEEAINTVKKRFASKAPFTSILDAVGYTPLVRVRIFEKDFPNARIYAKLEQFNPGGSVKDRPARQMICDALTEGALGNDKILIDATSGNTGVGYSMVGAALGVRIQLVMPENVSPGRIALARMYGTEIIFSDPMEGSDGAIRLVREIVSQEPARYYYPDQYSNPSNPRAHYLTTGPEIAAALGDRLTHFIAGIGTSGTIMGTGRFFKEWNPNVRVLAAEPSDSFHGLEGLKHMESSIVPSIWKPKEVDKIIAVETDPAWDLTEKLAREEGIFAGHSSGGALEAARIVLEKEPNAVIAVIFPDGGTRYLTPNETDLPYVW